MKLPIGAVLAAAGATLLLASCAGEYDQRQLTSALAAEQVGMDSCISRARAREFKTFNEYLQCLVPVQHTYVVQIKLKKMDVFDAYVARLTVAANDADAGRITAADFKSRYAVIVKNFNTAITEAEKTDLARQQAFFKAMQDAGQAMQEESARERAANPPSVMCNTTVNGNIASTMCN